MGFNRVTFSYLAPATQHMRFLVAIGRENKNSAVEAELLHAQCSVLREDFPIITMSKPSQVLNLY
jgi:hypothetical protein